MMSPVVTHTTSQSVLPLYMYVFLVFAFLSRILQTFSPQMQQQPSINCTRWLHVSAVEVTTSTLTHVESAETHIRYSEGLSHQHADVKYCHQLPIT